MKKNVESNQFSIDFYKILNVRTMIKTKGFSMDLLYHAYVKEYIIALIKLLYIGPCILKKNKISTKSIERDSLNFKLSNTLDTQQFPNEPFGFPITPKSTPGYSKPFS